MTKLITTWLTIVFLATSLAFAQEAAKEQRTDFLKIAVSPHTIKQGQTFTVFVEASRKFKTLKLRVFGKEQKVFRIWHEQHQYLYRSFLGARLDQKPGNYKIIAEGIDLQGETIRFSTTLNVKPGGYPVQRIRLTKKKSSLINNESLIEEGRILASRFRQTDKKVYFASHFLLPLNGRRSSPFGVRRQYNNLEFSSFHKGIDIARRTGTPIKAANGGKVSLTASMASNGKIILINHGHGVTSIYSHLNEILVKEGEWVKRGQVIAKVGSTGISSGPHLHFGISVNNVRVNPQQWLDEKVTLYYNQD